MFSKITPVLGIVCVSALGCAGTTPRELVDARTAYKQASAGPAAQANPAQLHVAAQSLKLAEKSYEDEGSTARTRDRAYIAMRKAQLADVQARIVTSEQQAAAYEQQAQLAQQRTAAQTKEQMAAQLQQAEQQRMEAERRAQEALAQIANVKQDERGTVITLSGSVLFPSGKAELLPSAKRRLTDVANTLAQSNPNASIVVEGHTDSKGSEDLNLELSTKRAEVVRDFLAQHGVEKDRIKAEGYGFSKPVADNKSPEGRANNRRVEIVIEKQRPPQG